VLEPPAETLKQPLWIYHPSYGRRKPLPLVGGRVPEIQGICTRTFFFKGCMVGACLFLKSHQNEFIGKTFPTCNICMVKAERKGVGGYMIEVVCLEE